MTDQQFVPLAQRYMDTVFRVAYGYLRSRSDADDVTQDVLIRLYKTDTAFENEEHLKRWLIRVTVNCCKNVFRSPWRRVEDIADYENTLPFDAPECRELFDAVMALDKKAEGDGVRCVLLTKIGACTGTVIRGAQLEALL